jgi:hypothetical protein
MGTCFTVVSTFWLLSMALCPIKSKGMIVVLIRIWLSGPDKHLMFIHKKPIERPFDCAYALFNSLIVHPHGCALYVLFTAYSRVHNFSCWHGETAIIIKHKSLVYVVLPLVTLQYARWGGGQICCINNEVKAKKVGYLNYLQKMTYLILKLLVWK